MISCTVSGQQDVTTNSNCTYVYSGTGWDATAIDNCSVSSLTYTLTGVTAGTGTSLNTVAFNTGITTVTWTAKDAANNTVSCNYTVSVTDDDLPVINCPVTGQQNVTTTAACTYVHSGTGWNATASDNCSVTSLSYTLSGATTGTGTTLNNVAFNTGVTTVLWTAKDAANNSVTCSFTVSVSDDDPPSLTCKANATRGTNTGCTYVAAGNEFDLAASSDNCAITSTSYQLSGATIAGPTSGTTLAGVAFNTGVTNVAWTVYDAAGQSATCNFTVTVSDDDSPVLSCAGNSVVGTNSGDNYVVVATEFNLVSSSDNCAITSTTYQLSGATTIAETSGTTLAGISLNLGITTITWKVSDAAGHSATCTTSVTVNDDDIPTLACVSNQIVGTNTGCTYVVAGTEFNLTASSDNVAITNTTYQLSGVTTIAETSGTSLAGIVFNRGVTTVTWKVYDGAGNSATCSFTVTVNDDDNPSVSCVANQVVTTTVGCTYVTTATEFDLTGSSDNCAVTNTTYQLSGETVIAETAGTTLAGKIFNKGITTVTWKVYDAAGNSGSCNFTVTVNDDDLPSLTCVANQVVGTTVGCTYVVPGTAFDLTASSDNCAVTNTTYQLTGATIVGETSSSSLAGVAFAKGVTTVTWKVYDAAGNSAPCSFTVTVNDDDVPVLTCKADQSVGTNTGCTYVVTAAEFDLAAFSDNCAITNTTYQLSGATTLGVTSGTTLAGRVFNNGVTTVTWTIYDAAGQSATCNFTVTVSDDDNPSIGCVGNQSVGTNTACTYVVAGTEFNLTGSSDNCAITNTTYQLSGVTNIAETSGTTLAGIVFNSGVTTVTWKVFDAAGNSSTCSFTVTVNDDDNPVLACIANQSVGSNLGCTYVVAGTEFNFTGSSDNCSVTTTSYQLTGATIIGETSGSTLAGVIFNNGITTVTWRAYDAAGNSSSCSFTVTVTDNVSPVLTCVADQVVGTNTGCTYVVAGNEFNLTGSSDNCGIINTTYQLAGATTSAETSGTSLAGKTFNSGVTTVTWKVYDSVGNSASCSFTVTVNDDDNPSVTCVSDQIVGTNDACSYKVAGNEFDPALTSDNCGVTNASYQLAGATVVGATPGSTLAGVSFNKGVTTVTWRVFDAAGNSSACSFTVTVNDDDPPLIVCPGDQTAGTNNGCTYIVSGIEFDLISSSDNCAITNTTYQLSGVTTLGETSGTSLAGVTFNPGITFVIWKVYDAAGNSASCTFKVTVIDDVNPTITCPANVATTTSANGAGNCTTTAVLGIPVTGDNCSVAGIVAKVGVTVIDPGTYLFPIGVTTVTWTVTDGSGNTASCDQTVTVTDDEDPTIACPANVATVTSANGSGDCTTTAVLGTPVTTDNCSVAGVVAQVGGVTITPATHLFPIGVTTVTWIVTDGSGLTASCTQTVTVTDDENPAITCPADVATVTSANGTGNCTTTAVLGVPVTSDNCSVAGVVAQVGGLTIDPATYLFPIGETTVNWIVTDGSGRTANCNQKVTVTDDEDPTIACPADVVTVTSANGTGNCTTTAVLGAPVTTDNCSVAGVVAQVGGATIDPATYLFPIGTTPVTWIVTDGSGRTASCTQSVTVTDDENPTIVCQPGIVTVTSADGAGNCTTTASIGTPVTADNCSVASVVAQVGGSAIDPATYLFPIGITTVNWIVIDGSGNTVSCNQTVTVTDDENPTISCPADVVTVTSANGTGNCTTTAVLGAPVTGDNCSVAGVVAQVGGATINPATYLFPIGVTTVNWIVTDGSGRTANCNQKVTVTDDEDPTIACPANVVTTTSADGTGNCTTTAVLGAPVTTDNCSVAGIVAQVGGVTITPATHLFPIGVTTVTWIVTDGSGRTATCNQTVTVTDDENPVLTCPADVITVTSADGTGNCTTIIPPGVYVASDNCSVSSVIAQVGGATINPLTYQFPIGVTTVAWIATDASGNTATCNQTVTVTDNENPTIACPANVVTVTSADGAGNCTTTAALGAPVTGDNCSVAGVVAQVGGSTIDPATYLFPIGVTTVTWIVTDGSGNTASCNQTVTITDDEDPAITCPANVVTVTSADGTGNCTTTAALGLPVTSDNCSIASVVAQVGGTTIVPASYLFPIGVTTITWIVTDGSGNTTSCDQTVTVTDDENPTIVCPLNVTAETSDDGTGNCTTTVPLGTPVTSDNCSVASVVARVGAVIIDPVTYLFPIGITTVTWTVTDGSGLTADCNQTVTVTDDEDPSFTVPADIIICRNPDCSFDKTIAVTGDVTDESDNCAAGIQAFIFSDIESNPFNCSNAGFITRTWRLEDGNGNIVDKQQIIWVEPVLVITAPGDEICDNTSTNIIVSTANTTKNGMRYTWTVTDLNGIGDITGYSDNLTGNPIASPLVQTLVNTTPVARKITYNIIPWSIDGNGNNQCSGAAITVDIWINPQPSINVVSDPELCYTGSAVFDITNLNTVNTGTTWYYDVETTYPLGVTGSWPTGLTDQTATGIAALTDNLVNTTNDFKTVTYKFIPHIRPGDGGDECEAGVEVTIEVVINPQPKIAVTTDPELCYTGSAVFDITKSEYSQYRNYLVLRSGTCCLSFGR